MVRKGQNQWRDKAGHITLTHEASWILSLPGGGSLDLGEDFEDGDFGIVLKKERGTPENPRLIEGDRKPVAPVEYDDLGNLVTSGADPGRADTLYDSDGCDHVKGLGGNDRSDVILGGADILPYRQAA